MIFIASSFVASLLLGVIGRDRLLVAALRARLGQRASLWVVAAACGAATLVLAAMIGGEMQSLAAPVRRAACALALAVGAAQCLMLGPPVPPAEPTRSLGAIGLALAMLTIADPLRLTVLALGAASARPGWVAVAAAGGAIAGWLVGARIEARRLTPWRRTAGTLLIAGAIAFGAF